VALGAKYAKDFSSTKVRHRCCSLLLQHGACDHKPEAKGTTFWVFPRKVTAKQVLVNGHGESVHLLVSTFPHTLMLQMGEVNPFNKTLLSATYKSILDSRKKLPVFSQMHEFYEIVRRPTLNAQKDFTHQFSNNQVLIMVGETGSGKTTHYGSSFTVLKSSLINFQDTSICRSVGSSPHQRQNFGMHSTSSCCSHVRCVWPKKWMVCPWLFSAIAHTFMFLYSLAREGSGLHDSVRGYDRSRHYIPQVYDRWNAPSRGETPCAGL